MNTQWQDLRIGDRIRITHIPSEFLQPNYRFPDETRTLYELLIERGEILTVDQICDHGLPWISYDETLDDGTTSYHSLAVNDTSWELVTDN